LIQQIKKIKLPAFEKCREIDPCDPDKIQKYIKGDPSNLNFIDFPKYKCSELSDAEKTKKKEFIKKYWNISVEEYFFYVGNLSESNLLTSITGQVEYNGLDIEKGKNHLIHELLWKILILKDIERITDILRNVHLIPLCIFNASDVSDKDITVALSVHNEGFRLFSLTTEVTGDNRIILDAIADTLIEENILDPACSSGSLLLKAEKVPGRDAIRNGFYGQEINITTYNLCRINMFLHDVGFDKFNIACEDTLTNPQHWDDEPFELIVSNPPYSIKWVGRMPHC